MPRCRPPAGVTLLSPRLDYELPALGHSAVRVGDGLVRDVAAAVVGLVPHAGVLEVACPADALRHGAVGEIVHEHAWRRNHDLIASAHLRVEGPVTVGIRAAGAVDDWGGARHQTPLRHM